MVSRWRVANAIPHHYYRSRQSCTGGPLILTWLYFGPGCHRSYGSGWCIGRTTHTQERIEEKGTALLFEKIMVSSEISGRESREKSIPIPPCKVSDEHDSYGTATKPRPVVQESRSSPSVRFLRHSCRTYTCQSPSHIHF